MYYLRFFIYDVGACKHKPINTKEAVRNDMYKKTEVVSAEWSLFFVKQEKRYGILMVSPTEKTTYYITPAICF
jgi:hypothetical protein